MKKKRLLIIIGVFVIVLVGLFIYWFVYSKPTSFPNHEQLTKEMNLIFPEAKVEVIQDTIHLDEKHVFVPFISAENQYGVSYWGWQNRKWNVGSISTTGEPHIWKIDEKDSSTFHFVWNMQPEDQVHHIKFFLIRDRSFYVTDGVEDYSPRIQLDNNVALNNKSYGVSQLSKEWVSVIDSHEEFLLSKQPDMFFNSFFSNPSMHFGWVPYNEKNEVSFGKGSYNSTGYSNLDVNTEFVMFLDKMEIE